MKIKSIDFSTEEIEEEEETEAYDSEAITLRCPPLVFTDEDCPITERLH